jgi:hypothetical protein
MTNALMHLSFFGASLTKFIDQSPLGLLGTVSCLRSTAALLLCLFYASRG